MDFVARLPIIGVLDNNNGDRAMEATTLRDADAAAAHQPARA
jgi:hypothetical protein